MATVLAYLSLLKVAHFIVDVRGCHNKSIWNFDGGQEWTDKEQSLVLDLVKPDYIKRVSCLGGEPMLPQNLQALSSLLFKVKRQKPSIKTWLWSGYTWEQLQQKYSKNQDFQTILQNLDYLIDGPFIQEQKDLTLKWRGSANQRVIDVPQTLRQNKLVILDVDD